MPDFCMIPVGALRLSEDNARQDGPGDVAELVASIREHGVLVPLHVVGRGTFFDVIDGQRRMTAALAAEIAEVPAIVYAEDEAVRSAEIGVAINVVRQQLTTYNIAQAAGHVLRQAGFKLDEVGALATIKKGADKLRKMPEIQQAAAGCGIDVDTFITYGAVSSLEPVWLERLAEGKTTMSVLGLALSFSKEERATVIEKSNGGWIDGRMLWALREQESSALEMRHALFSKKAGIEEGSDLFGGTGRIAPGSVKLFFERQQAAAAELAKMLKDQFDVDVPVIVGEPPYGTGTDQASIEKKDLGDLEAKLFPEWRGDRSEWTIKSIHISPAYGRVSIGLLRNSAAARRSESGQETRASKGLLEQLDAYLYVRLTKAVLADPEPLIRLAAASLQHWQIRSHSGEGFSPAHGRAYPFSKLTRRKPAEIMERKGNQLRSEMALALLQNLAVRDLKGNEWTRGTRHLLAVYDIDPEADLGSLPTFLNKLPGSWLQAQCEARGLPVTTKAKMASALADKLGEGWWPAWLDGFTPKEMDFSEAVEEDNADEQVDPAAQPEVHAAHSGDTPRGTADEDAPAGDDEGDDFDAPPRG